MLLAQAFRLGVPATIHPGIALKDNKVALGFGSAGSGSGTRSIAALLSVLGHGMTPQQAIDAGRGVCGTISSSQASGVSPEEIRSTIVTELQSKGLDGGQAANFMWAAADIYCPQYNDVVGD